jgi:hypothetical protein
LGSAGVLGARQPQGHENPGGGAGPALELLFDEIAIHLAHTGAHDGGRGVHAAHIGLQQGRDVVCHQHADSACRLQDCRLDDEVANATVDERDLALHGAGIGS